MNYKYCAYIALGGNLGDTKDTFRQACAFLEDRVGTISSRSSLYTTQALLAPGSSIAQPDYLNCVVAIGSNLEPTNILRECLAIEGGLGRIRTPSVRWEARTLDLDLLAVNEIQLTEPSLIIPHPQLHNRDFVLVPLCEIAPNWRHPIIGKTTLELLEELGQRGQSFIKSKEPFNS